MANSTTHRPTNPNANTLTGAALLASESLVSEFREQMERAAASGFRQFEPPALIVQALNELGVEFLPIFAEAFWQTELAAWLDALQWNAKLLPAWLKQHLAETRGRGGPPDITLWYPRAFGDDDDVRFPLIENAAKSLLDRSILTRDQFDSAAEAFRAKSFTVAGDLTREAIGQVRDVLRDLTVQGPTLREFRETIQDRLNTGLLGPAHVETVYRTNIQAAYRDGRESLLNNPIVADVFPYQEYHPTEDARTRPEHTALGRLGLDGTGIYRRDDPVWDRFTPPWDYNCRCAVTLLTVDRAAERGVKEAQRWIETGRPPERPEYRIQYIPFQPKSGFGQRVGVLV